MSTSNNHHDSKDLKRDPSKPLHRRLVLMFDGTGNKRLNLSNVARMFEAIDDSEPEHYASYTKVGPGVSCGKHVLEPDRQPLQLVKYIKGVGTNVLGKLSGLGFGFGLSANVIEGYVWLSNHYREGDEIFVFGFSRGAFSARSLVSLVHRCGGVLKSKSISTNNDSYLKEDSPVVVKAYDMYQAYVQTTTSDGEKRKNPAFQKDYYYARQDFTSTAKKENLCIQRVPVKMLGVWDTVGALGIPETGIKFIDDHVLPFSSKQYQFHDQGLSCIVENAYHALAIDEHRRHFAPTLWDAVTPENREVKQVWFVGSHCNVGGGADLEDFDDPDDLWQYSYVWMQQHAKKHGLRFYWTYDSPPTQSNSSQGTPRPTRRVSLRKTEDSYSNFLGGVYKRVCSRFDRKAIETNGAKLHWSVTDRIALSVRQGEIPAYCPRTLFGRYGTQFTPVEPDRVEFQKLDVDTPDLVKETLWQIESDDAEETSEPPLHRLPECKCDCRDEVAKPAQQTGFWSWLGF